MQYSKPWDGTTVGDATLAPYDGPNAWAEIWRSFVGADHNEDLSGIFTSTDYQLDASTIGTASPVYINAGIAMVHGTWYRSTAEENIIIPTPAVSTRQDRIVIRKDWTAQEVRLHRIAGAEGGGEPPLEQTDGDVWDEPIANVSITTAGVITLIDQRKFVYPAPLPYVDAGVRTTALSVPVPNNTATAIPWNANFFESTVVQANQMHSPTGNNERFYAIVDGVYEVQGRVLLTVGATAICRLLLVLGAYVSLSGTNVYHHTIVEVDFSSGNTMILPPTKIHMNKGEYVQLIVHQNSGLAGTALMAESGNPLRSEYGRVTFRLVSTDR